MNIVAKTKQERLLKDVVNEVLHVLISLLNFFLNFFQQSVYHCIIWR